MARSEFHSGDEMSTVNACGSVVRNKCGTTVSCCEKMVGLLTSWDNQWLIAKAYIARVSVFVFLDFNHALFYIVKSPRIITLEEA